MESLWDILPSFSLNKDYGFQSESIEEDRLIRVLQKTGTDIQGNAHDLEICSCSFQFLLLCFLPVGIRDRVQPSVKAGESDVRFRERSVLWFCTSFIAQIIACIHCFPHWATSIPFLGLLQIDSADSWLCQDLFQILIFLCTNSPRSSSKMGLYHLLSARAGSSPGLTLCLHRAQNSIGCRGARQKEE